MDRELDASYRYRRLGRRAAWGVGGVALGVAILVLLPGWLRPSVARAEIRTGRVDRGPVEGIVEASGIVIPAFEGVLSSPIDARVEKILKRPGEVVKAGEEILQLDTSTARLQLEKIEDQLAKKVNEQRQLRISLEKSLSDLRGQIERQKLDAEALAYRAEQNRKLRADGLGLTLVQEILSQHGFEFSLAPGEDGGAEFRVGFWGSPCRPIDCVFGGSHARLKAVCTAASRAGTL